MSGFRNEVCLPTHLFLIMGLLHLYEWRVIEEMEKSYSPQMQLRSKWDSHNVSDSIVLKTKESSKMWYWTTLIPAHKWQHQADLCEFQFNLFYTAIHRPAISIVPKYMIYRYRYDIYLYISYYNRLNLTNNS